MVDLRLGDCLELMKQIPDGSVDMVLCDLPYGTTACKWDAVIPFNLLWEQYERVVKDTSAIVLFGQEPFSSALRISNPGLYRYDYTEILAVPFVDAGSYQAYLYNSTDGTIENMTERSLMCHWSVV